MSRRHTLILRLLGSFSLFFGYFPPSMFLRERFCGIYENGVTQDILLPELLFYGVLFLLCFGAAEVLTRPGNYVFTAIARPLSLPGDAEKNGSRLAVACCYLLAVPAGFAAYAFFSYIDPAARMPGFESGLAALCVILAVRCGLCAYGEILALRYALGGALALILTSMIDWYYDGAVRSVIPVMMGLFVLLGLIVMNQSGLDNNVFAKRRVSGSLPSGIRRTSLVVIGVIATGAVILLALREQVTELIGALVLFIVTAVLFILSLVGHFMNIAMIGGEEQEAATNNFDFSAIMDPNRVVDYVAFAIFAVVVAYFLYKILPRALPWLKNAYRRFMSRFFSMFDRKLTDEDENAAYRDVVEELSGGGGGILGMFRRDGPRLSALRRITDPVERMRYTYRVAVYELSRRTKLSRADTTGELRVKSREVPDAAEPFTRLSDGYERVRYRGDLPDEHMLHAAKTDAQTLRRLK